LMPLHRQHDGQSVIDATSTMIVMRLLQTVARLL
jgi:hypothetical protein